MTIALAALLAAVAAGLSTRAAFAAANTNAAEDKSPTAEQVAESVVFIYSGGNRARLEQIQRSGVERGRVTRTNAEGKTEEINYERRFVRGESSAKDKVRLDRKMPSMEYALVYNGGRVWGVINNTVFTPRQDAVVEFLSDRQHGLDALLRYKENGATLTLVGKDKQKNIDMWVLDLVDKEKRRTRYYISSQKLRVLWLEYEETPDGGAQPVKFKRTFHDYRYAQGTLVPYRTVLYQDGKQAEETNVLSVSFGLKVEDALFQNSDTASANGL